MDPKFNVRKNPFGAQTPTENDVKPIIEKEEIKKINNIVPPIKNNNLPPSKSVNTLPPKQKDKITEKEIIQSPSPINNQQNNNNNNDDVVMKEFENLKNFNCSKNFIRLTTDRLPANSGLVKECSFPIGFILTPLAIGDVEMPIINYGEKDIPRCSSTNCRAYINPFVKWIEGGEKWICNICKSVTTTEDYYYAKLDKYNNRIDINERQDLNSGTYEYIAGKAYMKKDKNPNPPTYIFIIDVSLASISNGYLSAVLESIKDTINNGVIENPERTKIAFITYDTSVHFYSLNKKYSQPQMLCVSDDNIFIPSTTESLLVDLLENKKIILNALDLIQSSFQTNSCKDSNKVFTAINAGYLLAKNTGGKLIIFNASTSMINLPIMKSNMIINIPKDELVYTPTDDKKISTMGINMTNENISCDLFLAGDAFLNIITLNQLCDYTNGNLYFYKNFRLDAHYKNLFNQIRKTITKPTGWEAVVRTRFSRGYKISSFVTPVLISNGDLLIMSAIDSDQSYAMGLDVADQADASGKNMNVAFANDSFVYIQSAVLYTHSEGTRRIRIHNACYPIANRLFDIFNSIDVETLATFYLKSIIDKIFKSKKIANSVISADVSYKGFVSTVLSTQQSLKKELPDNLTILPLYVLGMLKNRVCCRDEIERKLDIDLSNYLRIKIQKMNLYDIMAFIYPRIYALHGILDDGSLGNYDENNNVILPQVNFLINIYF